jgi:orotate phosphoribosyltransferase
MTEQMAQTAYDKDGLTAVIFSTKAVSIWNNAKGPVFWYAAGVPGPFYVNTEKLIGTEAAERLLAQISKIVDEADTPKQKADKVESVVMAEYNSNITFQKIIATMIRDSIAQFGSAYNTVSGGERRDWFFSIPFAIESGLDHIYLFKDGSIHTKHHGTPKPHIQPKVLHVADLINNAASYIDKWIPILKSNDLAMAGTACVINRGTAGIDKLKEVGIDTCSLKTIDKSFFDDLSAIKLIEESVAQEINLYFVSKEDWARKYILSKPDLIGKEKLDAKSKERLQSFLENDPWNLKANDNDAFLNLVASLK